MNILVLGGTGYVGGNLLPRLAERGYDIRCLVRNPTNKMPANLGIIRGDATDELAVKDAVSGCEKIIYLIHSMEGKARSFEEVDLRIARNVAAAVQGTKVNQIIYLGGLGDKQKALSPHLRSRYEVARMLRSSGVPVTELRAAVIIGSGSASFKMIKSLVTHLPIMICPKWVNVKTQPIAIGDVLEYITRSLEIPAVAGKTIDIGGTSILSYKEMMLSVARLMNYRRLIIPVPVLTPWLSSHWVNLVTDVDASLARALIESVRTETICENDMARRLFDFEPIGFDDAVMLALNQDRACPKNALS